MENLSKNQEGLLKALAIAFPMGVIKEETPKKVKIRFAAALINNEQFTNLSTLSTLYKKEVKIWKTTAIYHIELTDKEGEDEN